MTSVETDQPWYQELPPCPLKPDKTCPGECQYILAHDECAHEPRGRRRLRRLGILVEGSGRGRHDRLHTSEP
jgi:hypothetical protein